ncbi:MAG: hypothetical protein Q8N05_15870 [Bacteroidota bacterium]|nr:hypothetical protein [Bacteroidota bacterium]
MENISSVNGLQNAIQILEFEQTYKEQLLKKQFLLTFESLKPVNILRSTIHEAATSPYLIDNILGATVGLASGYISRKITVGGSGNRFRKLLGSVIQFGVTNLVAQHPDTIRSIGQFILQHIPRKKEMNSERP